MGLGLQWIVDKITFPSPPSSYSLTSHPELFFVKNPKSRSSYPGVPCMLYAIPQGAPVLLVHAHSNGCDIGDMRQTLQSISESLRVHVMSFEFPGYGLHVGSASMRAIDDAAAAVLNYLVDELHVNPSQVVWYGRSIGSGPALRIAHRITKEHQRQPGGVILQCGYANFPEVAGHLFGRMAKQLVSPLWPNEAMVHELHCPVLLIHGRNDTMIPIEQSQKLWDGVSMKDLSNFHTCECGHNDFNFRRCTLRPIYDFLLNVVGSADYPSTSFHMDVSSTSRAFVHHIGALRCKIPVYSFRRPDLEDWMRRLLKRGLPDNLEMVEDGGQAAVALAAAELAAITPGQNAAGATAKEQGSTTLRGKASEGAASKGNPVIGDAAKTEAPPATSGQPTPTPSAASVPPNGGAKKGKKGKGNVEEPPIPDFSEMPPVEDVETALLDPEGMVRTCARRLDAFLARLQRQLDRVEGLEAKSLDEVVDFVEAEYWVCDPLLCLWEEVSLPHGDRVRIRLGPFSVDSAGEKHYDPELSTGSSSPSGSLLRVPLWIFCPSAAHFRCLAEWSLLHSERLERSLPSVAGHSGGCCCVPCHRLHSKRKAHAGGRRGRKGNGLGTHPTRGILSTYFAAHFVNWVEKAEEVRSMFARFATLHKNPEDGLRRLLGSPSASLFAQMGPVIKDMECEFPPQPSVANEGAASEVSVDHSVEVEEVPQVKPSSHMWPAHAAPARSPMQAEARLGQQAQHCHTSALCEAIAVSGPGVPSRSPPWPPLSFSVSSRAVLREAGSGAPGPLLSEFQAGLWPSEANSTAVRRDTNEVLKLLTELDKIVADRNVDWTAAGLILHYERLLAGPPAPSGGNAMGSLSAAGGAAEGCGASSMPILSGWTVANEQAWGDPLRPELRTAGMAVNKAMKMFAQAEHRERREQDSRRPKASARISVLPTVAAATADYAGPPPPPGAAEAQRGTNTVPVSAAVAPSPDGKPAQPGPGQVMTSRGL